MKEKQLRAGIRKMLLEQVRAASGKEFKNLLKADLNDRFSGSVSFASHSAKQAEERGHKPPSSDSALVIKTSADKAAVTDAINSSEYVQSVKNLGTRIYRKFYSTLEVVSKEGSTIYVIIDDGKREGVPPGSILTDKNLGKAAEYAIAAALKSALDRGQSMDDLVLAMYDKFLAEANPEGRNVSAAPEEAQTDFFTAFKDMARGAEDGIINADLNFDDAQVATTQDAIADIDTASADIHVKLNSARLGGIHRIAEIPAPASKSINISSPQDPESQEVPGRSTDLYENIIAELIEKHAPSGNLKQQRHFIRDNHRQELVDALESRGYLQQLAIDVQDVLDTGSSRGKDTYYFTFKTTPGSAFMGVVIEKLSVGQVGRLAVERNSPDGSGYPSTTQLFKITNADPVGDAAPGTLELITVEFRGDRKPQMHRGADFGNLSKRLTPESKQSSHPGLLESLSGLMVEAYAPGTKVGLVPMAAKPYHAGHHSLVETAAAENDQVLLYISLSDRKRKGELTIRGEDMERIWKEEIEKILPGNVTPVYGGIPVRKVYEILGDAEEKLSMGVEPPVYTVYSDPIDTGRNYPAGSRAKYFPTVASEGYVKFAGEETPEAFTRGEGTPDVSGTKMRAALQCGDEAAFAEGLPTGVDKVKIFNMLCPIQRMKSTVEEASFRMAVKRAHRKAILQEQSLYDTFVKPFSDVVAVAKLTAQDVLAASILNLRLWWNIGDLEGQAKAFEKYDKAKQEIKAKMKPYMDAIDARLAESDVSIIAAAVAPGFFFGQMGLEGAYNASKGTLDFLKGAGLELPVISTLFDGEEPESRKTDRPKDEGLLGGLKKLFFGESAQLSDLPIILEQEEKKDEPKPEKPPFDEAMATYLKDSGVEEKLEEMGRDLLQASKEYYEQLITHVTAVAEITNELNAIDTTSDNVDIDAVRAIMEKAKQSGLPGAEDFEAKIDQAAEKLSDNPEFEEKADELADKAEKQGDDKPGATDEEEKKAAANIAVVEFIDSFKEDSKEGLPQLIKSVREKIEEDKPQGINVKALNTSDIGKEYLQLLSSVETKLDELAGVAA